MVNRFIFFQIITSIILFTSCDDILVEYEDNLRSGKSIDLTICEILNYKESFFGNTFSNDSSLTLKNLYDIHSIDTNSFIKLSNDNSWDISIDSMCYFMIFAPQEADSYFVGLNSSSEFSLFDSNGQLVIPYSEKISMENIAGCSSNRVREVYADLYGVYLGTISNPNVSNIKLVFMNTNNPPIADFSTSSMNSDIGDTITFFDQSEAGSYPIVSYEWDFGDTYSSNEPKNTVHVYGDSGVFSPSLKVSDGYLSNSIKKFDLIKINNLTSGL